MQWLERAMPMRIAVAGRMDYCPLMTFIAEDAMLRREKIIFLLDRKGEKHRWFWGFIYGHDGSTTLINYDEVPKGQWYHYEVDLLDPQVWVDPRGWPLPSLAKLISISMGGNGWDFEGRMDNVRLRAGREVD